jgi:hypothetical protein
LSTEAEVEAHCRSILHNPIAKALSVPSFAEISAFNLSPALDAEAEHFSSLK